MGKHTSGPRKDQEGQRVIRKMSGKEACPECGSKGLKPKHKHCPECGAENPFFRREEPPWYQEWLPRDKPGELAFNVTIVVVLIAVIVLLTVFSEKSRIYIILGAVMAVAILVFKVVEGVYKASPRTIPLVVGLPFVLVSTVVFLYLGLLIAEMIRRDDSGNILWAIIVGAFGLFLLLCGIIVIYLSKEGNPSTSAEWNPNGESLTEGQRRWIRFWGRHIGLGVVFVLSIIIVVWAGLATLIIIRHLNGQNRDRAQIAALEEGITFENSLVESCSGPMTLYDSDSETSYEAYRVPMTEYDSKELQEQESSISALFPVVGLNIDVDENADVNVAEGNMSAIEGAAIYLHSANKSLQNLYDIVNSYGELVDIDENSEVTYEIDDARRDLVRAQELFEQVKK